MVDEFQPIVGGIRVGNVDWGAILVSSVKAIAAGDDQPLLFDTFLDAALRTCDRSPGERSDLAGEVLPLIRGLQVGGYTDSVCHGLRAVMSAYAPAPSRFVYVEDRLSFELLLSVLRSIEAGVARPFLAMPTGTDGSIDPAVLDERESALRGLPRAALPGRGERLAAELRCGPRSESVMTARMGKWTPESGRWACPTIDVVWNRQAGRKATRPMELDGSGGGWAGTAWTLSLTPHHPDIAAAKAIGGLRDSAEREPTRFSGYSLLPLLRRYADPNVSLGEFAPLVLALGIGAKSALHRRAASDAVLGAIATGRVSIEAIQSTLTELLELDVLKQARCRTFVREIAASNADIGDAITTAIGPKRATPKATPRATANYRTMLTSMIAPALAEHGFMGTLENYARTDGDRVAEIAFQRHRMVTSTLLMFTVNLSLRDGDTVLLNRRIGAVTPAKTDTWLIVSDDTSSITTAGTAILTALEHYAIPALTA